MSRLFLFCLMMCAVFAGSACQSKVPFVTGSPHSSPHRVDDSIIVAFPDGLQDRMYRIRIGNFLDKHTLIIPVLDVYRSETVARMNGMFGRGVTLTNHSNLESLFSDMGIENTTVPLRKAEAKPDEEPADPRRELDAILADLEAREAGDKTIEKTAEKLAEEAAEAAQREAIIEKRSGYILIYRDAQFAMQDSRPFVIFEVSFMDAKTGNVFFTKRYRGHGTRFSPHQSHKTNSDDLVRLTKLAMSGPMIQLTEDIAKATGTWTPRR